MVQGECDFCGRMATNAYGVSRTGAMRVVQLCEEDREPFERALKVGTMVRAMPAMNRRSVATLESL